MGFMAARPSVSSAGRGCTATGAAHTAPPADAAHSLSAALHSLPSLTSFFIDPNGSCLGSSYTAAGRCVAPHALAHNGLRDRRDTANNNFHYKTCAAHLQGASIHQDQRGAERGQPRARRGVRLRAVRAHDRQAAQAQRAAELQQRLADRAGRRVQDDSIPRLRVRPRSPLTRHSQPATLSADCTTASCLCLVQRRHASWFTACEPYAVMPGVARLQPRRLLQQAVGRAQLRRQRRQLYLRAGAWLKVWAFRQVSMKVWARSTVKRTSLTCGMNAMSACLPDKPVA